jgi:uncharacterized protein (DUF486 family)
MNHISSPVLVAALMLDYLYAGLCLMGAVYFIFRS